MNKQEQEQFDALNAANAKQSEEIVNLRKANKLLEDDNNRLVKTISGLNNKITEAKNENLLLVKSRDAIQEKLDGIHSEYKDAGKVRTAPGVILPAIGEKVISTHKDSLTEKDEEMTVLSYNNDGSLNVETRKHNFIKRYHDWYKLPEGCKTLNYAQEEKVK